jgi:nucleotide-binding universal stress UspA family protein
VKPHLIHSIFHPTDFSAGDVHALNHAVRLALAQHCRLEVMHVLVPGFEGGQADGFPSIRELVQRWESHAPTATASGHGMKAVKSIKVGRHPVEELAAHVERDAPDLVVLATHQRHSWLLPPPMISKAAGIARSSPNLTLFVPRSTEGFVEPVSGAVRIRRVLVPVAPEIPAQVAIDSVAAMVRSLGCDAVHWVGLTVGSRNEANPAALPTGEGWTSEWVRRSGSVESVIVDAANELEADLVVMTTRSGTGFLGSLRATTVERVLETCPCPLLSVNQSTLAAG